MTNRQQACEECEYSQANIHFYFFSFTFTFSQAGQDEHSVKLFQFTLFTFKYFTFGNPTFFNKQVG